MNAKLSVVSPCGDVRLLPYFLQSLLAQTLSSDDFELLLVTEYPAEAAEVLRQFRFGFQCAILPYCREPGFSGHTAGAARNVGAARAAHEVLVFIDADCIAHPDCLLTYSEQRFAGLVLCGRMPELPAPEHYRLRVGHYLSFDDIQGSLGRDYRDQFVEPPENRAPDWEFCYSANMAVGRHLFWQVGGFDETGWRCHDLELGYRFFRAGATFIYQRNAVVAHLEHPRILEFRKEQARGWELLAEKFPELRPLCADRIVWLKRSYEQTKRRCENLFSEITRNLPGHRYDLDWLLSPPYQARDLERHLNGLPFLRTTRNETIEYQLRLDRNCWDYRIIVATAPAATAPRVSVVIPAFNASAHIRRAIKSVFAQTHQAFELIVVDDGSSDLLIDACDGFLDDPRMRLIRRSDNGGLAVALNEALHRVTTDILVHLDADDRIEREALASIVEAFDQDPSLGAVYGSPVQQASEPESPAPTAITTPEALLEYRGVQAPRAYATKALRAIGGWSTRDAYRGRFFEDRLTLARIAERFKVGTLPHRLYRVHVTRDTLSRRSPITTASAKLAILWEVAATGGRHLDYSYNGHVLCGNFGSPIFRAGTGQRWSVIVPTHDQGPLLQLALRSWLQSDFAEREGEIIVVDDGSAPRVEVPEDVGRNRVRVIRSEHRKGPAWARNEGAAVARYEMLFFSDGDHIVPPNVLNLHEARHARAGRPAVVIGGIMGRRTYSYVDPRLEPHRKERLLEILAFRDDYFDIAGDLAVERPVDLFDHNYADIWHRASQYAVTDPWLASWASIIIAFGEDLEQYPYRWTRVGTGNLSLSRDTFCGSGGFDSRFLSIEDWELGARLQDLGVAIVCAPESEPYHQVHPVAADRRQRNVQGLELLREKHAAKVAFLTAPSAPVPSPAQAVLRAYAAAVAVPLPTPDRDKPETSPAVCALTFDDGPHPVGTPEILNALDESESPATFFLLGHAAQASPALCRTIADAGHCLGVHGWHHTRADVHSFREVFDQFSRAKRTLEDCAGAPVRFLRPPYGIVTHAVVETANALGLIIVGWDVSSEDWSSPTVAEMVRRLAVGGLKGRILLLHDAAGDPLETATVVRWVGRTCRRHGIVAQTLDTFAKIRPLPPLAISAVQPWYANA